MLLRSCELRKNRWSERHTSLPTSLPGHYLCLSVCLSVCLSTYPSISLCIYTCLCIYLSNCMEHSPSWSQSRNSLYLMEPEGSLPHSQKPTTVPLLSRINPVHASHLISWSSILILSSHIRLGLLSSVVSSCFPAETLYVRHSLFHRTCHIPHQSHSSWLDHLNDTIPKSMRLCIVFHIFRPISLNFRTGHIRTDSLSGWVLWKSA